MTKPLAIKKFGKKPTTLVIVSDMHVGNKNAVCSPHATIEQPKESTKYDPNSIQREIYTYWHQCAQEFYNPDVMVIVGEPMDGENKKSVPEQWSSNFIDQMNDAQRLIEEYKPKKVYVLRGSNYHDMASFQEMAKIFGAKIKAEKVEDSYAPPIINLKLNGKVFNFAHHISMGSGWYKSTPISKEMFVSHLNASHLYADGEEADVIIRGHTHSFWISQSPSKIGINLPAWKAYDWYATQKSASNVWDTGMVAITVSETGHVDIKPRLFKVKAAMPPAIVISGVKKGKASGAGNGGYFP